MDAYDGVTKHFSYEAFIPAWDQLGRMAVTVASPQAQPEGLGWQVTEMGGRRHFVVDGRWLIGPD